MAQQIKIGMIADFPEGEGKVVEFDGEKYAVFKIDGRLFATTNTCPHQGGPLGDGMLSGCQVTCPLHGWVFDVKSGQCQNFETVTIETFPVVANENGEVFLVIE